MLIEGLLSLLKEAFSAVYFVGYITNSQSFPYPLSVDEEQKYLELFHQGDEEARYIFLIMN
jgi:RNA polymerase sporulation-specific sigma factor